MRAGIGRRAVNRAGGGEGDMRRGLECRRHVQPGEPLYLGGGNFAPDIAFAALRPQPLRHLRVRRRDHARRYVHRAADAAAAAIAFRLAV